MLAAALEKAAPPNVYTERTAVTTQTNKRLGIRDQVYRNPGKQKEARLSEVAPLLASRKS